MNELQSAFWWSVGGLSFVTVIILIVDHIVNSVGTEIDSLFIIFTMWAVVLTIWFGNYHEILRGDCK